MSSVQIFGRTFLDGLQTTRDERGQQAFNGFRVFSNTRVAKNKAERRPGMRQLYTLAPNTSAVTLVSGEPLTASLNLKAWEFASGSWTIETFLRVNTGAAGTVLDTNSIVIEVDSGTLTLTIQFDAGPYIFTTTYPENTPFHIAFLRIEDLYQLRIDGEVSETLYSTEIILPATQLVVGDVDGAMDFLRLRSKLPTQWRDRESRLLNPRGQGVRACYRDGLDENGIWWDHSRYEMHARGSARADAAVMSPAHNPVQLIHTYLDENDHVALYIVAGGRSYIGRYS